MMRRRIRFYALLLVVIFVTSIMSYPASNLRRPNLRRAPDMALPDLLASAAGALRDFTPYLHPPEVVSYTTPINTPCGRLEANNAFYCTKNHTVYYDYNFINGVYRNVGDFAVVTILAHEWGHALQAHLGAAKGSRYNIQLELQADCFAGAFADYAEYMGYLEDRDLDEAAKGLFEAGDPKGIPWFNVYAHGSPLERVKAFLSGYDGHQCFCTCPY